MNWKEKVRSLGEHQPEPIVFADLPCCHRGEVLRHEDCGGCGRKREPIASCTLHGECSVRRVWGVAGTCLICEDRIDTRDQQP